ncbi:hypothetical protein [Microcystis phage Mvi-JY20]|uniref:Uncharacterized protein n=1 Tax=Microcystis phage Mvi-JY20 TaxID=3128146 RepID=A0AAX4QGG9_9CAUD
MRLVGKPQRLLALGVWGSKIGLNTGTVIKPRTDTEDGFYLYCEQGRFEFTHKALHARFNELIKDGYVLDSVCMWLKDVDFESHADAKISVYLRLKNDA